MDGTQKILHNSFRMWRVHTSMAASTHRPICSPVILVHSTSIITPLITYSWSTRASVQLLQNGQIEINYLFYCICFALTFFCDLRTRQQSDCILNNWIRVESLPNIRLNAVVSFCQRFEMFWTSLHAHRCYGKIIIIVRPKLAHIRYNRFDDEWAANEHMMMQKSSD